MKHFKEDSGKDSSNRVIFVIGSLWNMAMSTILVLRVPTIDPLIVMAFFSGMEAVLIGLKLGQKPMEEKTLNKEK